MERKKKRVRTIGIASPHSVRRSSQFIGLGSQISVFVLGIKYVFSYQGLSF